MFTEASDIGSVGFLDGGRKHQAKLQGDAGNHRVNAGDHRVNLLGNKLVQRFQGLNAAEPEEINVKRGLEKSKKKKKDVEKGGANLCAKSVLEMRGTT